MHKLHSFQRIFLIDEHSIYLTYDFQYYEWVKIENQYTNSEFKVVQSSHTHARIDKMDQSILWTEQHCDISHALDDINQYVMLRVLLVAIIYKFKDIDVFFTYRTLKLEVDMNDNDCPKHWSGLILFYCKFIGWNRGDIETDRRPLVFEH